LYLKIKSFNHKIESFNHKIESSNPKIESSNPEIESLNSKIKSLVSVFTPGKLKSWLGCGGKDSRDKQNFLAFLG
jgi:hypothetical protein